MANNNNGKGRDGPVHLLPPRPPTPPLVRDAAVLPEQRKPTPPPLQDSINNHVPKRVGPYSIDTSRKVPHTQDMYYAVDTSNGRAVVVKILDADLVKSFTFGLVDGSDLQARISAFSSRIKKLYHDKCAEIKDFQTISNGRGLLVLSFESANKPGEQAQLDNRTMPIVLDTMGIFQANARFLGQTIHGYQLTALLGIGASGSVFLGIQPKVTARSAVKILNPPPDGSREIHRFRVVQEAKALARLDHPNIVRFIGYAEDLPNDKIALLMQYIEGRPLADCIYDPEFTAKYGRFGVLEAFRQVLEALHYAHNVNIPVLDEAGKPTGRTTKGIIHRDIKPDNLVITEVDGKLKAHVLDFGLAKLTKDSMDPTKTMTATGHVVGTPAYLPPEFFEKTKDNDPATPRSDIFSVGASLFHFLTRKKLFQEPMDAYNYHKEKKLPPSLRASGVPASPQLEEFSRCMLHSDPSQRYQSAEEAMVALTALPEYLALNKVKTLPTTQALRTTGSIPAPPPSAVQPEITTPRKSLLGPVVITTIIGTLLGSGAGYLSRRPGLTNGFHRGLKSAIASLGYRKPAEEKPPVKPYKYNIDPALIEGLIKQGATPAMIYEFETKGVYPTIPPKEIQQVQAAVKAEPVQPVIQSPPDQIQAPAVAVPAKVETPKRIKATRDSAPAQAPVASPFADAQVAREVQQPSEVIIKIPIQPVSPDEFTSALESKLPDIFNYAVSNLSQELPAEWGVAGLKIMPDGRVIVRYFKVTENEADSSDLPSIRKNPDPTPAGFAELLRKAINDQLSVLPTVPVTIEYTFPIGN